MTLLRGTLSLVKSLPSALGSQCQSLGAGSGNVLGHVTRLHRHDGIQTRREGLEAEHDGVAQQQRLFT